MLDLKHVLISSDFRRGETTHPVLGTHLSFHSLHRVAPAPEVSVRAFNAWSSGTTAHMSAPAELHMQRTQHGDETCSYWWRTVFPMRRRCRSSRGQLHRSLRRCGSDRLASVTPYSRTAAGTDAHHGSRIQSRNFGNIPCQPAGNPYPYSSTLGSAQPNASGLLIFLGHPNRD